MTTFPHPKWETLLHEFSLSHLMGSALGYTLPFTCSSMSVHAYVHVRVYMHMCMYIVHLPVTYMYMYMYNAISNIQPPLIIIMPI